MRSICGLACSLFALASTVSASTIDVSTQNFQALQTGNTLIFVFSATGYAKVAAQLNISPYPTQINFDFVSSAPIAPGDFTVELESLDGSTSVSFPGTLQWQSGYASTSEYSGLASLAQDSFKLAPAASQAIFRDGYAELILDYAGDPVTVGLSGYSLPHSMFISLGGGPIAGIGGIVSNAYFDPPDPSQIPVDAPEPGAEWLVYGGAVFCLVALGLKRVTRGRA